MTRLMLGTSYNDPSLLVEVQETGNGSFKFWVVNGAWEGEFIYHEPMILGCGDVYIDYTKEVIKDVVILCDDQDQLRGGYENVFLHFQDESYVAPRPREVELLADWDDDIAF